MYASHFLLDNLRHQIATHKNQSYYVAYSGGMDSHVLLHAMQQLRNLTADFELQAIHVHHGLSKQADFWMQHCQKTCAQLQVPLHCEIMSDKPSFGDSVEAWARQARYAIFRKILPADGVLLTAHHQDDQAETVLLQLLRGAGPKGLAAMPHQQKLGTGLLLRPLLAYTREQLQSYAQQQNLTWIEDESNVDLRFDRNYLRQQVIPLLRQRWPAMATTMSRSAKHCAEVSVIVDDIAARDLAAVQTIDPYQLNITALHVLPLSRQRYVLRHWLSSLTGRLPNSHHLQHIQRDLLTSRNDATPQVCWNQWIVRRYRQSLILSPAPTKVSHSDQALAWDLTAPLTLPNQLGSLSAVQEIGGLALTVDRNQLSIRFRRGGERCRVAGSRHHSSLKKLMQSWGVPPWQRDSIPLLYYEEQLASVIGYCICEPFAAAPGTIGWNIKVGK